MVADKIVDIEVCVTQKYTRRSYVIAYMSLPMQQACRRLLKEKYSLQPRIGARLPENMKVYNAEMPSRKTTLSNPSLNRRRLTSQSSWAVPYVERASSEANLAKVVVDIPSSAMPSIEIDVPSSDDDELQEALKQIAIMERSESTRGCSTGQNLIEMSDLGSCSIPGSTELEIVEVKDPVKVAEVLVHLPQEASASGRGRRAVETSDSVSLLSSRPETPVWDYYDEPPMFSLVPIDINESVPPLPDSSGDVPQPLLPVATSLELPQGRSSVRQKAEQRIQMQEEDFELAVFSEQDPQREKKNVDVESCLGPADRRARKKRDLKDFEDVVRVHQQDKQCTKSRASDDVESRIGYTEQKSRSSGSNNGKHIKQSVVNQSRKDSRKTKIQMVQEERDVGVKKIGKENMEADLDLPVLHRKKRGRPKP